METLEKAWELLERSEELVAYQKPFEAGMSLKMRIWEECKLPGTKLG